MRDEFRQIYSELYEGVIRSRLIASIFLLPRALKSRKYPILYHSFRNLSIFTKKEIDKAINDLDLKDRIRSDAKYFLLLNFSHMVAYPTIVFQEEEYSILYKEYLLSDLKLILSNAEELTKNKEEITTTDIVASLPNVWEKLKLNATKMWGVLE
jgi:hypothetical protein